MYGTSGIGGVWGKVDEGESVECLLYALEQGVTSFDTSPSYHQAERYLGQALQRWKGQRPFISTKLGRLVAEKADDFRLDYSPAGMRESVLRSTDQLGPVDLLFLHEPQLVPLENMRAIIDTLQELVAQGYTRMLGVGGNPPPQFFPYLEPDNFQVVSGFLKMNACNLTAFQKDIPYFQKRGIAYYAASALHMGLLGRRFEALTREAPESDWYSKQDIATAQAVHQIAVNHDIPLSTLAQRYLFSVREADRVVMGARTMDQIKSTLADWEQGALPEAIFNEVTRTVLYTK